MKKTNMLIMSLLSIIAICSCGDNSGISNRGFGDFSYKGIFLNEYATEQINVEKAKDLVDISSDIPLKKEAIRTKDKSNDDNINTVLTKYASLVTTVKYYISEAKEQQVRKEIYQGTDFMFLLESNHYEPFGQMSVRYIFVDDELLDKLEKENTLFKESGSYITSPFNEPYTYHTNEDNNLILQTHSFAELPASTCGGIGSTFKQDCELIFDKEGKIMFWQSSLGLYTSTPTGTVKEGFIFEVSFEWNNK